MNKSELRARLRELKKEKKKLEESNKFLLDELDNPENDGPPSKGTIVEILEFIERAGTAFAAAAPHLEKAGITSLDDVIAAFSKQVDGPTLEFSREELSGVLNKRYELAVTRRLQLIEGIAEMEARKAEHDDDHKPHTLDDLKPEAQTKIREYLGRLEKAVGYYLANPIAARPRNGELLLLLAIPRNNQPVDADYVGLPWKVLPIDIRRHLEMGHVITKEDATLLVDTVSQAMIDAAAPCCEGCKDGSGGCLDKQLANAKNQLAMNEREIAFWALAIPKLANRRTHLTLAQLAKLCGLPGQMFDGL